MSRTESLLAELRHSPCLPDLLSEIRDQLKEEESRREQFYHDITPEQKVEFIRGEVILHAPARNRHLDVTIKIARLLSIYVELHGFGSVKVEKCLVVFPRNDYEPNIVYFGPAKAAGLQPNTVKFPIPDLAVEVLSDSTEARDRGVKFEDFAAHGVAEYWIVDAEIPVLEQYILSGCEYDLKLKSSGLIESDVIPGFAANLEAFFDSGANLEAVQELVNAKK